MSRFVLTAQLQLQAPTNTAQVVRQIQSQLNNVQVNVQVQGTAQATRQVQQVAQSLNAANSAASNLGRTFAISVKRFTALAVATRAVSLFTNTLANATQEAIDFERQLVKVSQVTGESIAELRFLTKTITGLATGFGVSSKSLLEVSTVLLQAGVNSRDTEVALKSLAKAALAPNFDSITETAEGAIAILAQFQEGVGSLENQLSSINAVAGAFAVEAGDLIDVIRRTGGIFKASGGSLNELLALFTSVRATTRESAESIGTGLRTIFTRIQRPKTIEFLKQFGIELVDLEGKFVGPFEAIKRLSESLTGLGERDVTFIRVAEELGGFRQIGKVLPLLQQFATAEQALNVAQKANNGLTKDAETAQQALAIRITKVKEEFLALVRSITETSSFQFFANTTLNLASSLIKLADALKPIIPLLTAVASIKLAQGLSGFIGGFGRGIGSARTFNQGGKVLKFARGGMVPGSGNGDTVPAMLQPGEFVIRKSSVNKLGAGNLAAMNENKYAFGGKARKFGIAALSPMNKPLDEVKATIPISNIRKYLAKKSGGKKLISRGNIRNVDDTIRGILGLKGQESVKTSAIAETISKQDVASKIEKRVELSIQKLIDNAATVLGKSLTINVERKADNAIVKSVGSASTIGSVFEGALSMLGAPMDTSKSEQDPLDFPNGLGPNFASAFQSLVGIPVDAKKTATRDILKKTAYSKASNYLANAVYSDPRWQMMASNTPSQSRQWEDLKSGESIDYRSLGYSSLREARLAMPSGFDIRRLGSGTVFTKRAFGGLIQKFATGGGVGTDTVPALLTPGEFVINKKSAQSIGYGSLNRMNKVGKYANGGVVQKFALGGQTRSSGGGIGIDISAIQNAINLLTLNFADLSKNIAVTVGNVATSLINFGKITNQVAGNQIAAAAATGQMTQAQVQARVAQLQQNQALLTNVASSIKQNSIQIIQTANTLKNSQAQAQCASATNRNITAQQNASKFSLGIGGTLSLVTSSLQALLPPLDETSGVALKLSYSFLSMATSVGAAIFALESFGISLNKQSIMNFLGGGGIGKRSLAGIRGGLTNIGIPKNIATNITGAVNGLSKLAGPLAAIAASAYLAKTAFDVVIKSIYDFDGRLKGAIEKGNISSARAVAEERATFEGASAFRTVSAGAGAIAGFLLGGPFGAAIGAAIGAGAGTIIANGITAIFGETALDSLNTLFGGNVRDSAIKLAESQAGAVKTQQDLVKAQKTATESMNDFNKGSITASEALSKIRESTQSVIDQEKRATDFSISNTRNRSTGGFAVARNIFTLGGLIGESATARNTRLDKESATQIQQASQFEAERFQLESEARRATIRSAVARGATVENITSEAVGGLRERRTALLQTAGNLLRRGDTEGSEAAEAAAKQLGEQIDATTKEIENITKEVLRAREALNAMNLGLRSAEATSSAVSASLNRFQDGLEVGGSTFVADVEFLSVAMSSAAQAIDPEQVKSAISNISTTLNDLGVNPGFVNKFKLNTETFIEAQRNYAVSVKKIIEENKIAGKLPSPLEFQNEIATELTKGLDVVAATNLKKVIRGINLTNTDIEQIFEGNNLNIFSDKLGEATKKQFEEISSIGKNFEAATKVLIDLTKKRIDAERSLLQAQKDAIDLTIEGREVQAAAGGPALTIAERRAAVINKANIDLRGAGLGDIGAGNVNDFRNINRQILQRTAQFQNRARLDGGVGGVGGVQAVEQQANVEKAYKSQIDTIKQLIKLEQDEIKLIKEKNSLEKSSIDALISGDIDKFFEQQAAVGAQAAIALDSDRLQRAFGASALGVAAQDIKRQQEAGQQTLFGQQLAGRGGLTERAFGAAIAARGVTDPRLVQVAAETTVEEEAINARLRNLGGLLGEMGNIGAAMASMEVQTATMNVQKAQINLLKQTVDRGNAAAQAAGLYRGGIVYANRGIFVPRGTDTVPAMLTPGEFVVRREAVQRGNNLQILQAMNRGQSQPSSNGTAIGMARGGVVNQTQYLAFGGFAKAISGLLDGDFVGKLTQSFSMFLSEMSKNIDKLNSTNFNIKLDTTNVNVNLNGTSFLSKMKDDLREELMREVANNIVNYKVGDGGSLRENRSILG